jgi:small-conductance mechanosensitive channel
VNGQHGVVEEISLTYIVIRMADNRRMIVPVTDFVSQPFENWTRKSPTIRVDTCLYVDHAAPLPTLRIRLRRILEDSDHWDGEEGSLTVVESDRDCLKLKLTMSAASPNQASLLGEQVMEQLITFLVQELPEALPRAVSSVLPASPEHNHPHRRHHAAKVPDIADNGES